MQSKILVIEDNSAIRAMVETALKEHGCDVIGFDKAKKALDWLAISNTDLIIIDYSVPDPKPEEICSKIRQNKNYTSTPILMLLTLPETKQNDSLKKVGVSDFVIKPFFPSDLIEMVDIYLLEKAATSTSSIDTKAVSKKEPKVKKEQKEQIDQTDSKDSTLERILSSTSGIDIDSILIERDGETTEGNAAPEKISLSDEDSPEPGKKGKLAFDDIPLVESGDSDKDPNHDFGWFLKEMERETQQNKKDPEMPQVKSEVPKTVAPQNKEASKKPAAVKPSAGMKDIDGDKIVSEERGTGRYEIKDTAELDQIKPEKSIEMGMEKGAMKEEPPLQPAEFNPQIVIEDEKVERFVDAVKDGKKETRSKLESMDKAELEKLYSQLTDRLAHKLAGEVANKINAEIIRKLLLEELEKIKG
ncbi:MAG: response regulator [candidate division Zixibacteria bacterium]|nr:response regulator [candidate division Zixibacteria bacterium]